MSMLAYASDKQMGFVRPVGAIMINTSQISERNSLPAKELPVGRETARRASSAEQLMYAWSMGTSRPQQTPERVSLRAKEECPPEVYLG